ncbi:hypothetical protein V7S43_004838 [Phytophthora oleae]|uniref:Uncharacterized protein n=1 Tax=Phytophthora oleae TaxID=2107226 RepID=A0ABD3FY02_9STRA
MQNEFIEVHDQQLLQVALPMEAKLAFVSVSSRKPLAALDANILALIFRFAEGRDVYRSIAFTDEIKCGCFTGIGG